MYPYNWWWWYYRGVAKFSIGDDKGAIADYTKAIEINPKDAQTYGRRGFSKAGLGDYTGAKIVLAQIGKRQQN